MKNIRRLSTQDVDFAAQLKSAVAWDESSNTQIEDAVDEIVKQVRSEGDKALVELTNKFDRVAVDSIDQLRVSKARIDQAFNAISAEQRGALQRAAERIRAFHTKQVQPSWQFEDEFGNMLGQQVRPLDSVGLYVPGGKASYPSSVLMNAIPARVAGVEKIVMVVPAPDGLLNDMVLAAAAIAEVDEIYRVGGAQAIAALAYGTESILPVDKIVGPGNIYVATAKKKVFGVVGIDMIAGPSEIMIVSDGSSNPDWVAMDLFSQAEHDELAQAILVSTDTRFLDAVEKSMAELLAQQPRADVIQTALENRGIMIVANDLDEAIGVVNQVAPEHLELAVDCPENLLSNIKHAGAIFLGHHTSEALGDYCAGPNHVLPTSGTARFSSPLGVYDFQKRSSLIHCSPQGASELGKVASVLARSESLTAHAESAEYRITDPSGG